QISLTAPLFKIIIIQLKILTIQNQISTYNFLKLQKIKNIGFFKKLKKY
ncbi:hypothetical protein cje154_07448, partial [Campylobacter jejuni subsp. jejuni 2008-988]